MGNGGGEADWINQRAGCLGWQTKVFRLSCSWVVGSHWKSLQAFVWAGSDIKSGYKETLQLS